MKVRFIELLRIVMLTIVAGNAMAQDQWPYYRGTQWGERHAKFSRIDKTTVANLVPRHVLQLGQVPYSFSASPLVIDGVLYVSASDGMLQAFDLRTGMRKWSFVHKIKSMSVDAKNGKTRWYFQVEPHGLWDRDQISPPVVSMLGDRKVIVHAGKTGEHIRHSDVVVPHKNMWVAPSLTPVTISPAAGGGNTWSPISVDSQRKLGFVGALDLEVEYTLEKEVDDSAHLGRSTKGMILGGDWVYDMTSVGGYLSAVNLTTGKIKWQNKSPMPFIGGVFSTSTGLVFQGESDGHLTAFDSDTGETLWQFNTGAGVNAPPIGFELDGEEFIAVAAGGTSLWGSPKGDSLFVFGLPKAWESGGTK